MRGEIPMPKSKVLETFELEGATQEVGAEVELSDEKATELGSKVEKVEEAGE